MNKDVEKLASKAAKEEHKLLALQGQFELENKQFAKFLKEQGERQRKVDDMWNQVKAALIAAGYFDVIENENFRLSVSKVFGVKVPDVERLPEEFTKTVKVPKMDEIKQNYELTGALPEGAVDNSYYRLNKKVK